MQTLSLGEKVRKLREAKKLSVRELARRSGISASFISGIEGGNRYPSVAALERLAGELGVSAAALRKLDNRSSLAQLRQLLESEPSWGPVFKRIATDARAGKITSSELLKRLGWEK